MSREPLITTVIPTYRRPALLKRAVFSVLNQSYADFIIRILDNASGDDTERVAQELIRRDSRVQYHRHPENIGSLNNMIYGMEGVATPYFSILCDDDLLMPDFFANGIRAHQRSEDGLAFASTRVVVVDEHGRFAAPWIGDDRGRVSPPEGMARCLRAGRSMPGVLYKTSAIRSIGVPRTAWWNWTESGWNALAGMNFAIEFLPDVGAIVYVHADSGSKRMDTVEFRISWFTMFAELRETAMRQAVSRRWWKTRIQPFAYTRFLGSAIRLCSRDGAPKYGTLAALGVASGLNAWAVSATITLGRLARALGLGGILNTAFDWWLQRGDRVATAQDRQLSDSSLTAASRVFSDLNRQAGYNVPG